MAKPIDSSVAKRIIKTHQMFLSKLSAVCDLRNTVREILKNKQQIFDAFADKSVAASESVELDEKTFGNIIKEEIDRINAKRGGHIQ